MFVGLCGKALAGKDTVARWLVQHHGFTHLKLSQSLKDVCGMVFELSDEQLEGHQKDTRDRRYNASPREILQYVGTDLFRAALGERFPRIGESIWIRCLERRMAHTASPSWVISDVRFPNEAKWIRRRGGFIVRIERGSFLNSTDTHPSERCSILPDYTLYNSNDHHYLTLQVRVMMERLIRLKRHS